MKKILIINVKPHTEIGGIETYSKKLINLFLKQNFQVFELPCSFDNTWNEVDSSNSNDNYHLLTNTTFWNKTWKNLIGPFFNTIKKNKFINKVIRENKIDIVVQNNFSFPKLKFLPNVKYVWVQHFDWWFYKSNKYAAFIKKILNIKDNFLFSNIVVYTKKDKDYLLAKKLVKNNTNIYSIVPGIISFNTHTHTQASAMKLHSLVDWIINKKIFNF
ncbi:glycosyltransferase family protein [Mycoplasmoides alvi]|uniref:hypothetical protein n=1 Tax=Mycoplasmoides alvi TaxID=78580 RepID=UPI00051B59CA|nr:hypothetical protein [Mycoplasmoides alvi]